MRKLALLGLITVVAAILFTGVAHADDYAGGTPPKAGSVAPSTHVMGQQFTNAPSTGQQGAQVLVQHNTCYASGKKLRDRMFYPPEHHHLITKFYQHLFGG